MVGKSGFKSSGERGGKGGRFLVLFTSGGRRVSLRFHLFVYDVNQGSEGAGRVQDFFAWLQEWKDSP